MTKSIKRIIILGMTFLTLISSLIVPRRISKAAITFNNTISASMDCDVTTNGNLIVVMDVLGISGTTTQISVELYVEKRILGIFWKKVDIGCANNTWTDSTASYTYSNICSFQLNSTGTYRVTVTYTVSGSGGTPDVITVRDTVTY